MYHNILHIRSLKLILGYHMISLNEFLKYFILSTINIQLDEFTSKYHIFSTWILRERYFTIR